MIIRIVFFTEQGKSLAEHIFSKGGWLPEYREREELSAFVEESFRKRLPLLFIGAMGIAVRAIAPYIKDKLTDSPVLVMDETGKYVIPVLAGHVGMANQLAKRLAEKISATAVITTATDREGLFAVDVFAVRNGLHIVNREGIRQVSAKVLRGEKVTMAIAPMYTLESSSIPKELSIVPWEDTFADIRVGAQEESGLKQTLFLKDKPYILGIGCKKGKSFEEIYDFIQQHVPCDLEKEVRGIASIDLKREEKGLWNVAQYLHIPFQVYSSEELAGVQGEFAASSFVLATTGVDNVCERSAIYMAGEGAKLVCKKVSENGVTLAVSKSLRRTLTFE